jgi:hypothetical protein
MILTSAIFSVTYLVSQTFPSEKRAVTLDCNGMAKCYPAIEIALGAAR